MMSYGKAVLSGTVAGAEPSVMEFAGWLLRHKDGLWGLFINPDDPIRPDRWVGPAEAFLRERGPEAFRAFPSWACRLESELQNLAHAGVRQTFGADWVARHLVRIAPETRSVVAPLLGDGVPDPFPREPGVGGLAIPEK